MCFLFVYHRKTQIFVLLFICKCKHIYNQSYSIHKMTQELIKIIDTPEGEKVVSARDLHEFLESKQDFSTWINARIKKYGFIENQEYTTFHKVVERAKRIEYALTVDAAKEIAMVEGNDKGKEARQYFIECEKRANALMKVMSPAEMLLFQAQRMVNMEKEQGEMKKQIELINARTTTRPDYFTVMGYSVFNKKSVGRDRAAIIGRRASMICKQRGLAVDKVNDPRFGLVGSYPTPILDEVFELLEIN